MNQMFRAFAPVLFLCLPLPSAAHAQGIEDPLRFFEGRTESSSTIKLMMKKPYRTHATGQGEIASDGSLKLVQRVEEPGEAPHLRRWHMRKVGPGRFTGTMSDAKGPVTVEKVGDRFRFRFKMKGGVSIEQWLTPTANGRAARNTLSIKKLGIKVGHSEGMIRKVD